MVQYAYNQAGLLAQVQRKETTDPAFLNVATFLAYSPLGQPITIAYANGTTTTNTYDADELYRLKHKVTVAPSVPVIGSSGTSVSGLNSIITSGTNKIGDLDGNGIIDIVDLVLLANSLAGNIPIVPAGDVNGDGVVDITDLVLHANFLAGNIPAPSIKSFTVSQSTINPGQSVLLSWQLTGTPAFLALNQSIGSVKNKTSFAVTPVQTTPYTLQALNIAGSDSNQVTVIVSQPQPIALGPQIQDITYKYDAVGNIVLIADNSDTNTKKTVAYTYDALNRLLSATATNSRNSSNNYTESYTYSPIGNILTKTVNGQTTVYAYTGNQGSSFANPQAVTKVGTDVLTYDKNGNVLSDGFTTYVWNYRNEMTQATVNGKTIFYGYDHTGQRTTVASGGGSTFYPTKWYNVSGSGIPTKHLFAGSMSVASIEGSDGSARVYSDHTDHLSGQGVTTEVSGKPIEVVDYFAFGSIRTHNQLGAYSEQRKFAGHEYDLETTLSYMDARYYQADGGRFLSLDPSFLAIGDDYAVRNLTGRPQVFQLINPQSLNSYSYANNNPIVNVDPNGSNSVAVGLDLFGAVITLPEELLALTVGAVAGVTFGYNPKVGGDNFDNLTPQQRAIVDPLSVPKSATITDRNDTFIGPRPITRNTVSQDDINKIGSGHSFDEHKNEFPGVNTPEDLSREVGRIINSPDTEVKNLERGRTGYLGLVKK